jgi:hypothetical protein
VLVWGIAAAGELDNYFEYVLVREKKLLSLMLVLWCIPVLTLSIKS